MEKNITKEEYVQARKDEYLELIEKFKATLDSNISNFQLEMTARQISFLNDLVYVIEDSSEFSDDELMPILLKKNLTLEELLARWGNYDLSLVDEIQDLIKYHLN